MIRLYLHLRSGGEFTRDAEGRDYESLVHARSIAVEGVRSLICADVGEGLVDLSGQIEIEDASGKLVSVVRYADVVELRVPKSGS